MPPDWRPKRGALRQCPRVLSQPWWSPRGATEG
jgi:hypothetical protein